MSSSIDLNLVRELEQRAFRAWPALETRSTHGWVQRLSGGYTKRANSINALSDVRRLASAFKSCATSRPACLGTEPSISVYR